MTTLAAQPSASTAPRPSDPARINGDWALSADQVRQYMDYHAARNARNAEASRREGIKTEPAPRCRTALPTNVSPARAALNSFFAYAARELAPRFTGRAVRIMDIGCGGAPCLEFFEAAGYRGEYIGIDIARKSSWTDAPTAAFSKRLILGDVLKLDVSALPPIDLLISSTALEHIEDDAAAIARLSGLLGKGGAQVHYVPGEGALPLYGPHGWRQYSPACLKRLLPGGRILRAGGPVSAVVHTFCITKPVARNQPTIMVRWPRSYALARDIALRLDRLLGNRPATMYGVIA